MNRLIPPSTPILDTDVMPDEPLTEPTATDEPSIAGPTAPPPPIKRLRRRSDAPVGGVASGLADYLGIDPVIVRILIVVLAVGGGSGFLLYLAAWILVPDDHDTDPRPVAFNSSLTAIIFGAIVLVAASSAVFGTVNLNFNESVIIPLLLIGAGFYLLNQRAVTGQDEPTATAWSPTPAAAPPPPSGPDSNDLVHWATPIVAEPPAPADPKPPVTSVTLAVAATVVGILLVLGQLTSLTVGAGAVFGAIATVCGLGLVASAFVGRARPLVAVAVVALVGLSLAPLADATIAGGLGPREYRPDNQAELLPTYDVGAGYIELDLRNVDFVDDASLELDVGAGYAEVIAPTDVNLEIESRSRFGMVTILGDEQSGVDVDLVRSDQLREGAPTLRIIADVTFGAIEVRRG